MLNRSWLLLLSFPVMKCDDTLTLRATCAEWVIPVRLDIYMGMKEDKRQKKRVAET